MIRNNKYKIICEFLSVALLISIVLFLSNNMKSNIDSVYQAQIDALLEQKIIDVQYAKYKRDINDDGIEELFIATKDSDGYNIIGIFGYDKKSKSAIQLFRLMPVMVPELHLCTDDSILQGSTNWGEFCYVTKDNNILKNAAFRSGQDESRVIDTNELMWEAIK